MEEMTLCTLTLNINLLFLAHLSNAQVCLSIANCETRHCSNQYDVMCNKCVHDEVYFRRWNKNTQCARMCSFDNHTCWPGTCTNDLTQGCQCAPGFRKVNDSSRTVCQLQSHNKPSITTCQTRMDGDVTKQTQSGSCSELEDFYGNFQPMSVTLSLQANFTVDITMVTRPSTPRRYIQQENFGITDASIFLKKRAISGSVIILYSLKMKNDTDQSTTATPSFYSMQRLMLTPEKYKLINGESLCVVYEVLGGGYIKPYDFTSNRVLSPVPFDKTTSRETICYRYDDANPQHCSFDGSCTGAIFEPLQISSRITKDPHVTVTFLGWKDPIPVGGIDKHASGLHSSEITVDEVVSGIVNPNYIFKKSLKVSETSLELDLPNESPKLFCVYLIVKDTADNVQKARRFILVDNTSYIRSDPEKPFTVSSASRETDFRWQSHLGRICLDWKDHFYNTFYLDNNVLGKIKLDPSMLSTYEQETGSLPVTGTQNVHGIIRFIFSWSKDGGDESQRENISNLLDQSFCKYLTLDDGETYILNIDAIDVVKNSYSENRTVHIDSTPPLVGNIYLLKDGAKHVIVQDDADIQRMVLHIEAADPHSGTLKLEWIFVDPDSETEPTSGVVYAKTFEQDRCFANVSGCYCPDVGACQTSFYRIPLKRLMERTDYSGYLNSTYNFTFKITNNALLSAVEQFDVQLQGQFSAKHGISRIDTMVLVISGAVTAVAALALILVSVVFCMRRRRNNSTYGAKDKALYNRSGITNTQAVEESAEDRYMALKFVNENKNDTDVYSTLSKGYRSSENEYVNLNFIKGSTVKAE